MEINIFSERCVVGDPSSTHLAGFLAGIFLLSKYLKFITNRSNPKYFTVQEELWRKFAVGIFHVFFMACLGEENNIGKYNRFQIAK